MATGRLPFGYRRDERKHVVPDERTAPTVKRIFHLYAQRRLGAAAIARTLAAEQAPAPPAGWQSAVVQLILDNEAYLGRVIWRGQSLAGLHEPIVDDVTFRRAQRAAASSVSGARTWPCGAATPETTYSPG